MLSLLRTLSLRQARRHAARTALMVLSVALGVATWTTTCALDATLEAAFRSSAAPLAGAADFQVNNGDLGVRRSLAARLATVPGVRQVRPVVIRRVALPELDHQSAVLVGVDLLAQRADAAELGLTISAGAPAAFARAALLGRSPVLVGGALDRRLPAGSNRLEVLVGGKRHRLARVGTIDARAGAATLGGFVLVTDARTAADLTADPGMATRLDVRLEPGADRDRVRRALEVVAAGTGRVQTPEASDRRILEALDGLRAAFSLCGIGALGLGLLLMAGTLGVGAAERRGEVGVLRALGADRGQLWGLFLSEALAMGVLGSALGVPLGWALARWSIGPMLGAVGDIFLPLEARGLEVDPRAIVGAVAAGVLTALLAAFVPTARAAAMRPVDALSRDPSDRRHRVHWWLLVAAVALLGLALACYGSGKAIDPRVRTFGALASGLLASVLAIPAASALAARLLRPLAERALGLVGRLAADHLTRSPGRGGLAIAAIAGGAALILQTGGVIHGSEEAIRGWVDACVSGDFFVTSGGPLSASGKMLPMPDDVGSTIEAEFPGSRVVPMRFRYLSWRRRGAEERILLVAMDASRYHAVNRARRPELADLDLYRRLSEPGTVLVSENFAALNRVKPGDTIGLPGVDGPVPLRVVGTVVDYSCNRGTLMVDRVRYRDRFAADGVDVFAVFRPSAGTDEETATRMRQSHWAAEHGLSILTHAELRGHILGMVARIYGVAYVQEVAAAVVAALGVASALLISVLQRRRELGLLRAIGATRGQAMSAILAEALLMAVIGVGCGLVLGVALEWYVLRVFLLEETGFVFPVRFPWSHAAAVAGVVILSCVTAGLLPAWKASRLRIVEAIACE